MPDPVAPEKKEIYDAKMAALKRIEKSIEKLVEITDQLLDADETIAKVESALKNNDTKEADSLRKSGKAMTDSIKKIRNFIMGTPLEKQGYGAVYEITVNKRVQEARGEVLGKDKIPDVQEFGLITMAESLVTDAIKKTNEFFNGKWKAYQLQADNTPMKLFKDYKLME